jgi:hypothetical protein
LVLRATRTLTGLPLAPLSIDCAVPTTSGGAGGGNGGGGGGGFGAGLGAGVGVELGGVALSPVPPPPPQALKQANSETTQPARSTAAGEDEVRRDRLRSHAMRI